MAKYEVELEVTVSLTLEADDPDEAHTIATDAMESLDLTMIDTFDVTDIDVTSNEEL